MAGGVGPKAPGSRGNGGKTAEIKVRLLDSVAAGVYANSMMVHHSATDVCARLHHGRGERGE